MAARIALFNDTSRSGHFGCDAVVDTILSVVRDRGGAVVYRHPVGQDWRGDAVAQDHMKQSDIVIVNGEGTIHHSAAGAVALSAVAPFARSLNKPVFLINATIQDNDASVVEGLSAFDGIWVRETRSSDELRRLGLSHDLCGDLSLHRALPPATRTVGRPIVIDSVRNELMHRLAAEARRLDAEALSMKYRDGKILAFPNPFPETGFTRSLMVERPVEGVQDHAGFAAFMGSHAWMLTGRFHSVCMALNMRLPFLAFPSNTWKIDAIAQDAGISLERIIHDGLEELLATEYSRDEIIAISSYMSSTRQRIDRMFKSILC